MTGYSLLVSLPCPATLNDLFSGLQPEKGLTKQNSGMSAAGLCLRWVETPVYTFDMICMKSENERGTLREFSGSFPVR